MSAKKTASKRDKTPAEKAKKSTGLGLAILAVILVPTLAYVFHEAMKVYRMVVPIKPHVLTENQCKHITGNRLEGCEDLAIHHRSSQVFLACGSVEKRRRGGDLNEHIGTEQDGLFVYHLETSELRELKLIGLEEAGFHTLGLGIWDPVTDDRTRQTTAEQDDDVITLMAINHRQNESVIEIFEHKLGSSEATLVETARHPLIQTPNSVYPVSARAFYTSNDLGSRKGWVRMFETLTAREWGSVVFRGEDGQAIVAAEPIGYANGIGANYNRDLIYVASSMRKLHIYERLPDNRLRLRDTVEVSVLADNVRVNPIDGSILVAGNIDGLEFIWAVLGPSNLTRVEVVRVSNNTGEDRFYGVKYKTDVVFGAHNPEAALLSTADYSPKHKKLVVTTLLGSGFLVCDKEL